MSQDGAINVKARVSLDDTAAPIATPSNVSIPNKSRQSHEPNVSSTPKSVRCVEASTFSILSDSSSSMASNAGSIGSDSPLLDEYLLTGSTFDQRLLKKVHEILDMMSIHFVFAWNLIASLDV